MEWLSNEDLIKRVVSLEFNRLLDYYADAQELDIPDERSRTKDSNSNEKKRSRRAEPGFTRMFINIGKTDGLYPNTLIDLINSNVQGRVTIGKIDLMTNFSFFEIEEKEARNVINGLKNIDFFGRRISVEEASNSGSPRESKRKNNDSAYRDRKNTRQGNSGRRRKYQESSSKRRR